MTKKLYQLFNLLLVIMIFTNCKSGTITESEIEDKNVGVIEGDNPLNLSKDVDINQRLSIYSLFELTSDVSHLSAKEKQILPLLFEVAQIMDDIFWRQTIGDKSAFLSRLNDEKAKQFAIINYGPWDRLNNNNPFIEGIGEKHKGANFYPANMTVEEFEAFDNLDKNSQYTLIRRDEEGKLKVVWYHQAYEQQVKRAAELLRQAAKLADNEGFKNYLNLRADALLTDKYQESDFAWMDMKTSNIDFVVGPIENYEDALFGLKAANESFILIKDNEWSKKLERFASLLPQLQKELPVSQEYKNETPGSDADLNAYDVVYYGGDCNAGSKTIAINLPNDESVQLKKGSRKLQLKNTMRAKFDKILMPISNTLLDESQKQNVKFDAFFSNTMFHEVAHGLGIKNTINGKGSVRSALKEQYSAIEECKADILGLFMVTKLYEMGELTEGNILDNYVTFMCGIFRSVRFGAASAHGKANMLTFNYFLEQNAFNLQNNGVYKVNFEQMKKAVESLGGLILKLQGKGDYEVVKNLIKEKSVINKQLQEDLKKLNLNNIPVDIVFKQSVSNLNL